MKVRVSEHQGVSPRTGKKLKGTLLTSMRDHVFDSNYLVDWNDRNEFWRESKHFRLGIKERLFIKRDRLSHNKNITMSAVKFWYLQCVSIGCGTCNFIRLLTSYCKQFTISFDVYLIMEALASESS